MAEKNRTIITKAYLNATNDFQQRIPDPTQHNISETIDALYQPMNNRYLNEFIDILVNRIGETYVHSQKFNNPLAIFKKSNMVYGSTIQEVAPKWLEAHTYRDTDIDVFKNNRPEAEVWYHSQNREDRYDITVIYDELRSAFTEEYGLNKFIASLMQVPINSDNYDEYKIMLQLIAEYENRWGFYKQNISELPTTKELGEEFLTKAQEYAGLLKFPSALYNAGDLDVPVFEQNRSNLVLFVTPAVQAVLNVKTLANLFNVEIADVEIQRVIVDEFPIPGAFALLTTKDFFMCKDTFKQTTSIFNPKTVGTNYFLHHWGVYSVSPFVPAILFTTDTGTSVKEITMTPSELVVTADSDSIYPGGTIQLHTDLQGAITGNNAGITVKPDSVIYEIKADDGVLNSRTRINGFGVLHLQKKGIEPGDKLTITATSTYINPSGATGIYTAEIEIDVVEEEINPEETVKLDYKPIKDATLEIVPSDVAMPEAQFVDKNTDNVPLPELPETLWTTDDGTESGTPGTWTATGWFDNAEGTGSELTEIDITTSDVTVYAKYTFVAS